MNWEVDHVFFATADADVVEERLVHAGLVFERWRTHPGQGTANACAVFENAYLEVLRAHDLGELRSAVVRPLGLEERIRWRQTGACPVGICFRTAQPDAFRVEDAFATWTYAAPYLPSGSGIAIVTPPASFREPLIFLSPSGRPAWLGKGSGPGHRLTGVRIRRPGGVSELSSGVRWFADQGLVDVEEGSDYGLDLEWDGGHRGSIPSLDPAIPISLRW
jgi:hypothetical protein